MRNRLQNHRRASALLWSLILLLTAQGCASAYRTLATSDVISDYPRDYFDPGDMARLTLSDGSQVAGKVTQLRSDSITLDETTVQWSDVVLAEMDEREKADLVTAFWITVPIIVVAGYAIMFAHAFKGVD